uniref:Uncharacterized protein n=1 Tax=Rhizophora mucronata TaxID=61149 RepID=A0A2P2NNZ0_RHIMU
MFGLLSSIYMISMFCLQIPFFLGGKMDHFGFSTCLAC